MRTIFVRFVLGLIGLLSATHTLAVPIVYTDRAIFNAALGSFAVSTLNFDSITAGTTLPSNGSAGGITFTYDFGSVQMMVTNVFDTTSPSNFLGTDDGDLFQDGDDFRIDFAAAHAVGMYFITADTANMLDDDIRLTVGGTSASLVLGDIQDTLSDGSDVFFLGIVDIAATFGFADITTFHDSDSGYYLWNVDDIVMARVPSGVPEPATLSLLSAGLIGLAFRRRRPQD